MSEASLVNFTAPVVVCNDPRLEHWKPIVPSDVKRGKHSASDTNTSESPQDKNMPTAEPAVPNDWMMVTHPDSGVYYVHKSIPGVCTFSNVLDSKIRSSVMEGVEILRGNLAPQVSPNEQTAGLVLNVQDEKTSYYYVSHADRRVSWLKRVAPEEKLDIPCEECKRSKGHCIAAQYWKHCELFPTTFMVTKGVIVHLKDILLQAAADRLLVNVSTSPYDKSDLEYMLNLVKELEADVREECSHAAWIIARFMALHNDGVLRSSYGQDDDDTDTESTRPRVNAYFIEPSIRLYRMMSPVGLHESFENFTLSRWLDIIEKTDQRMRDLNVASTVLLSTDVGLLAWSDAGKTGGLNSPTTAQILMYISVICSVGSIILSLVVYYRYRAGGKDTPLGVATMLKRLSKVPLGPDYFFITLTLPHFFLAFSLLAFLTAFCIIFYDATNVGVRAPVSVALFYVLYSLFICWYDPGLRKRKDQSQGQSRGDRLPASETV